MRGFPSTWGTPLCTMRRKDEVLCARWAHSFEAASCTSNAGRVASTWCQRWHQYNIVEHDVNISRIIACYCSFCMALQNHDAYSIGYLLLLWLRKVAFDFKWCELWTTNFWDILTKGVWKEVGWYTENMAGHMSSPYWHLWSWFPAWASSPFVEPCVVDSKRLRMSQVLDVTTSEDDKMFALCSVNKTWLDYIGLPRNRFSSCL